MLVSNWTFGSMVLHSTSIQKVLCSMHSVSFTFYCTPVGEWCIVISFSVCLGAYLWNRWTDLHKIFVQIPCDSVLLWRRCDTLCISSFIEDVTFGRNGPYDDAAIRSGV